MKLDMFGGIGLGFLCQVPSLLQSKYLVVSQETFGC